MMNSNKDQSHSWLKRANTESAAVETYYDAWANEYNKDLKGWEYKAPVESARLLKNVCSEKINILDAGCGTGLTGLALKEYGFNKIVGIDISKKSILIAEKTDAYSDLKRQDLQKHPFPFKADAFDAVNCVGVLAYIDDPLSLFKEFCRIVRPGGYAVFTHREDLAVSSNYKELLRTLEYQNYWKKRLISEPKLYLPKNDSFSDEIKVIYYLFQISEKG